jgi:ADP-ribose pyrophosphatase YjhB (NUDIX family)
MIEVNFYENIDDHLLKFAVIISKSQGKWVLCKHKNRSTFECPGGHREDREEILMAAIRELYEETGAADYSIQQICVYSVTAEDDTENIRETFGMLYYADIARFEALPESEIEEIVLLDSLPDNWTYPKIQPKLIDKITYVLMAGLTLSLKIINTESKNNDFISLTAQLDDDLNQRYGKLQTQYNKHNNLDYINGTVIIYKNEIPVACGAFKEHDAKSIELKRIFVKKEYRRQGLSKLIVHELEIIGKGKGYTSAYLETGINQPEAINLYRSSGYITTPNFEPYIGNKNSICMRKDFY